MRDSLVVVIENGSPHKLLESQAIGYGLPAPREQNIRFSLLIDLLGSLEMLPKVICHKLGNCAKEVKKGHEDRSILQEALSNESCEF
jgi:hypothetical protein